MDSTHACPSVSSATRSTEGRRIRGSATAADTDRLAGVHLDSTSDTH